ncbi:MFS family permease [Duganella sp. 1224]|uniref:FUSC family protein n=1 Tax=Duganella sp. 1224 TaxID=2587052 RepID=UPI0015C912FD|nr:FUSC family protein [Duganella sp. 1224]NYE61615.1 MFS family permease [Duganella sp. 1224]
MLKALVANATDKANLLEGMRAASASALMLLVGCALHAPDFAWAAIGAFWTSLATASDSARHRVASMLSFAALSTLTGGLTTYAASFGTMAGAAALFLWVTSAGLARIWGAKAYQVAILAATACVVMVDRPWHGDAGGMAWLAVYLVGCLFATALSVMIWQIGPQTPERYSTNWRQAAVQSVREGLRQLRDHATLSSDGLHFALRLGIATTVAYLTVHLLHLPYGYWATMAVLLILQPSASGTLPRSMERAVGTVVGTVIAIGISGVATSPLAIALAVFPLIGLTMTLRPAGYGVFVAFLTPSFVLVADYAMPLVDEYNYALARLENNLLGSAIAVIATLTLWPLTERLRKSVE